MESVKEIPLKQDDEQLKRKWKLTEDELEEEDSTTLDQEVISYEKKKNITDESDELAETDYASQIQDLSQKIIGDYSLSDFVRMDFETGPADESVVQPLEVKTSEFNRLSYNFLKLLGRASNGMSQRYLEKLRKQYVEEHGVDLKNLVLENLLERNKKKESRLLEGYRKYMGIISNIYRDIETATSKAEKLIALARRIEHDRTSLAKQCIDLKRDIETILVESDSENKYLLPALKKKLKQLEKKAETREKIYQIHIPSDVRTLRARVEYLNSFVQDLEYDKSLLVSEQVSTEEKRAVLETMLKVYSISSEFSNLGETYDAPLGQDTDNTIKLLQKEIGLHRKEKEAKRKKRYTAAPLNRLMPKTSHNYELLDIAKNKNEAKKAIDEGDDFFKGLEQEKRTRLFDYS